MSLTQPKLQVIMPVYNAQLFLRETLSTLLQQSFRQWQLLIIDDGSSDDSLRIIKEHAASDNRIFWRSRENRGLIATLNELVQWSTAPLLARMDADDLNTLQRFEKQLNFLSLHPDVDMVGCWVKLFGSREDLWRFRESDNNTKILSLFGRCCMLHASVIAKREVFETIPFDHDYPHMEDFVFLSDIITQTQFKFGNVREVLYHYRQHENSIIYQNEAIRKKRYRELQIRHLQGLGVSLTKSEYEFYWHFLDGKSAGVTLLSNIAAVLISIRRQLAKRLPDNYFEISLRWRQYCTANQQSQLYDLCGAQGYCFLDQK
jgi:glycosyltransferase involved in cell wall biosynthesis